MSRTRGSKRRIKADAVVKKRIEMDFNVYRLEQILPGSVHIRAPRVGRILQMSRDPGEKVPDSRIDMGTPDLCHNRIEFTLAKLQKAQKEPDQKIWKLKCIKPFFLSIKNSW